MSTQITCKVQQKDSTWEIAFLFCNWLCFSALNTCIFRLLGPLLHTDIRSQHWFHLYFKITPSTTPFRYTFSALIPSVFSDYPVHDTVQIYVLSIGSICILRWPRPRHRTDIRSQHWLHLYFKITPSTTPFRYTFSALIPSVFSDYPVHSTDIRSQHWFHLYFKITPSTTPFRYTFSALIPSVFSDYPVQDTVQIYVLSIDSICIFRLPRPRHRSDIRSQHWFHLYFQITPSTVQIYVLSIDSICILRWPRPRHRSDIRSQHWFHLYFQITTSTTSFRYTFSALIPSVFSDYPVHDTVQIYVLSIDSICILRWPRPRHRSDIRSQHWFHLYFKITPSTTPFRYTFSALIPSVF